ncbi:YggS family pyridoxal phosphate enzyme [candidate division WOR-1 bacterium RIFOXYA12_FULL_43_27]|uniref:Pyridoxal phosphate homeostasis protein n=1 Tax=candidate division WOR-1 bacterium RIFOXYC2_FULL_46_14 TaxID=1802587 RepID=A0A1F4U5X6_UNCSA|nr:MAG: YggS family pyridoxal phosphate enzyme [candidate division WOR-1 bacterium RIFOXYA12_FULL_43_27]OGC20374.1 MAG: YggS family pyridoxal phosphate enzyme [candidate division WOR-1 bacterium RIFOXYB2_FULL_46_45]OGC31889.1 MAG: YggS family pyridoxal phosphate enzyme [candidate division WOR-1 bacterium RIFOXYA2_FULL_46_56]OGC40220.1 MAG: YggS family pyridoxal phosphate enzyme [candidate division WOR-1 bacterium RIFOXYC2_FULL_46_14]
MIKENVKRILAELPSNVQLVAAAKTRTPEEINEAVDAGVKIIGENYFQEAEELVASSPEFVKRFKLHFIGHLQTNKIKRTVKIFDLIETLDSYKHAQEINRQCAKINKIMPVLIEINSGREEQKAGVFPEKAEEFVKEISRLKNIQIKGLMTMGPAKGDLRPYFKETKQLLDRLGLEILSMGMSDSYKVAIEEGATMVRIGTAIFGARKNKI